jgi:hypothetical protein
MRPSLIHATQHVFLAPLYLVAALLRPSTMPPRLFPQPEHPTAVAHLVAVPLRPSTTYARNVMKSTFCRGP